jgi:hypothetical protein
MLHKKLIAYVLDTNLSVLSIRLLNEGMTASLPGRMRPGWVLFALTLKANQRRFFELLDVITHHHWRILDVSMSIPKIIVGFLVH